MPDDYLDALVAASNLHPGWKKLPGVGKVPAKGATRPTARPSLTEADWLHVPQDETLLVLTGQESGIISIDFDGSIHELTGQRQNPATSHALFHDAAAAAEIFFPPTLTMTTGRINGRQEVYAVPPGHPLLQASSRQNVIEPGSGIDLKLGQNGYFVAPPSRCVGDQQERRWLPDSPPQPSMLTPEQADWILSLSAFAAPSQRPDIDGIPRRPNEYWESLLDGSETISEYRDVTMTALIGWLADPARQPLCPDKATALALVRDVYGRMRNPVEDFHPWDRYQEKVASKFDAFRARSEEKRRAAEPVEWIEHIKATNAALSAPLQGAPNPDASDEEPLPLNTRLGAEIGFARRFIDRHFRNSTRNNEIIKLYAKAPKEGLSEFRFIAYPEGGGRWVIDPDGTKDALVDQLGPMIEALAQTKNSDDPTEKADRDFLFKMAGKADSTTMCRRVAEAATAIPELRITAETTAHVFNRDRNMLSTRNGIVDLRTGHLRPTLPSDRTDKMTLGAFIPPPEFNPDEPQRNDREAIQRDVLERCPRWRHLLYTYAASEDEEVYRFLLQALGFTLFGERKPTKFFMLDGEGSNGKTTFILTIDGVLGDYSAIVPKSVFVSRPVGEAATNDLAMLEGARFASNGVELSNRDTINDEHIKNLSSLDPMPVRRLYQNYHMMQPEATCWIITNHLPKFKDTGTGMRRRYVRVHFDNPVAPEEKIDDFHLTLIDEEADAILTLMILHAVWYQEDIRSHAGRSIEMPEQIIMDTEEHVHDEDPLYAFGRACLYADSENPKQFFTPFRVLYEVYGKWCSFNHHLPLTRKQFADSISDFRRGRMRVNGVQERGLHVIVRWEPDMSDEQHSAEMYEHDDGDDNDTLQATYDQPAVPPPHGL